jgi:hypothetical protein
MGYEDGVASEHKFENVLSHKILADLLMLIFCTLLYLLTVLVEKIICIKVSAGIRATGPKYTKAKITDQ